MADTFTAVDLSQLPAPSIVEEIDFETIVAEMLADLQARDETFTALLESDPAYKILEVAAYREVLVRQRINEAAKGVMLAYATGDDLDNLGAFYEVERLTIDEGDPDAVPPVDPTYEDDDDFRRRIQLSLEGFSTAGPEGAYIYHALSADGSVLDASAISPSAGTVLVTILSRDDDGTASDELLETVNTALSDESVRPLTDLVTVQSATIINYEINATLYFYSGPGSDEVMANAQTAVEAYKETQHALGLDVTLSGIYAALHQSGVQRVELSSPTENITIDRQSASYCTAINLVDGGVDE